MATTKIDSFLDKKLLIKELQTGFQKEKKLEEGNAGGKLFKTNKLILLIRNYSKCLSLKST